MNPPSHASCESQALQVQIMPVDTLGASLLLQAGLTASTRGSVSLHSPFSCLEGSPTCLPSCQGLWVPPFFCIRALQLPFHQDLHVPPLVQCSPQQELCVPPFFPKHPITPPLLAMLGAVCAHLTLSPPPHLSSAIPFSVWEISSAECQQVKLCGEAKPSQDRVIVMLAGVNGRLGLVL